MKNQTSPLAPRRQRDYAGVLSSILAILAGLLVGLIVLLATNPSNAFPAFSALITGGFYSGMKTFGNVLYYAVPIIMTGLGVGFGFKASIFNIGGAGSITADGVKYELGYKDCLYITQGTKEVLFASEDAANPAKFYMVSAPAHRAYETKLIKIEDAAKKPLGAMETSNKRVINQFIHPDVLPTCQLSMGMTVLEPGSVWNTMPAHTHERRMEVYMYFEVPEDNVVFHMMGEGRETRHIVMQNEQAVISPSWSIHAGAGTSNYTFIWAMGGENQAFDDMDVIPTTELR